MSSANDTFDRNSNFFQNLPDGFVILDDPAQHRLLREYGAVFVARDGVIAPHKVVFTDESDVAAFQSRLEIRKASVAGFKLELQSVAMEKLLDARKEARTKGLTISPRGKDSARRNYDQTIELWLSRVEPALKHWVKRKRINAGHAAKIRSLAPFEQVPEVFALEEQGIFFAKDLSKSIIYSVAPPGASQHLSLLAFDVAEFNDPKVREILARHFWYQTVVSDLPHFTFLGVPAEELPALGLKQIESNERQFWVPDI